MPRLQSQIVGRPLTPGARFCSAPLALLCLTGLSLPGSARADLVVEMSGTTSAMMLAVIDTRLVFRLREDRARIETHSRVSSMGSSGKGEEESRLTIVRGDLGLSWMTDRGDTTYTEAPWPDTLTCPPSMLPAMDFGSVPFDFGDSLDWTHEVTRVAAADTIAGLPADRVTMRSTGRPGERAAKAHEQKIEDLRRTNPSVDEKYLPQPSAALTYIWDVWLTDEAPAAVDPLWRLFVSGSIRNDVSACMPVPTAPSDSSLAQLAKLEGMTLRIKVMIQLPGWSELSPAQLDSLALLSDSAPSMGQLVELLDLEHGAMTLLRFEVDSIREEPVPDELYELPAGLRKKPRETMWDYLSGPPAAPPTR